METFESPCPYRRPMPSVFLAFVCERCDDLEPVNAYRRNLKAIDEDVTGAAAAPPLQRLTKQRKLAYNKWQDAQKWKGNGDGGDGALTGTDE